MLSPRACSQDGACPDLDPAGTDGGRRAPVAVWRQRLRPLLYLRGALLALMLAFAPAAPARASLLDCVEAAVPSNPRIRTRRAGR